MTTNRFKPGIVYKVTVPDGKGTHRPAWLYSNLTLRRIPALDKYMLEYRKGLRTVPNKGLIFAFAELKRAKDFTRLIGYEYGPAVWKCHTSGYRSPTRREDQEFLSSPGDIITYIDAFWRRRDHNHLLSIAVGARCGMKRGVVLCKDLTLLERIN